MMTQGLALYWYCSSTSLSDVSNATQTGGEMEMRCHIRMSGRAIPKVLEEPSTERRRFHLSSSVTTAIPNHNCCPLSLNPRRRSQTYCQPQLWYPTSPNGLVLGNLLSFVASRFVVEIFGLGCGSGNVGSVEHMTMRRDENVLPRTPRNSRQGNHAPPPLPSSRPRNLFFWFPVSAIFFWFLFFAPAPSNIVSCLDRPFVYVAQRKNFSDQLCYVRRSDSRQKGKNFVLRKMDATHKNRWLRSPPFPSPSTSTIVHIDNGNS